MSTRIPPHGEALSREVLWRIFFGKTDSTLQQLARYVVVGGLAFVIDFGSLYLLTSHAGLHYLASAALAFLLGLTANYLLSRTWVFQNRTLSSTTIEFLAFAGIGLVGLGLNEVIMWCGSEFLHLHYLLAKIVSTAIVFIWNFTARKLTLFR